MSNAGNRDGGLFVALPHAVINSAAYRGLSHAARALLIDVAVQLSPRGENNGRLLCSRAYLAHLGWKSADTIHRAKSDLIKAELLFETVKGQRPNRASWYAVTWMSLPRLPGFDAGALESFRQGAYTARGPFKNASLCPSHGTGGAFAVPSHGPIGPSAVPSHGPTAPISGPSPVPSDGHLLDVFHLKNLSTGHHLHLAGGDWVLTDH